MEEIKQHVMLKTAYEDLPPPVRAVLGRSKPLYERVSLSHAFDHQLAWEGSSARHFLGESDYYKELIQHMRGKLRVFPYHLIRPVLEYCKLTPFSYYHRMMYELVKGERSYDSLPNFTAADCVRLLHIGRNQYIDLCQKCKAKFLWKSRGVAKDLLPAEPFADYPIQCWWRTFSVLHVPTAGVPPQRVREKLQSMASKLRIHDPETLEAFSFLATLPSPDGCECGRIPQHVLRELYRKQAILFSVPVNPSDVVVVPTLRGFVMNRSIQECDVFERVLYDFLLTTDSHTTVQDVAEILQQNTDLVCFVASIALRLGFACKLNAPNPSPEWKSESRIPATSSAGNGWEAVEICPEDLLAASREMEMKVSNTTALEKGDAGSSGGQRMCFLFDSTLAAFLMMGNLSATLKDFAVTIFEAGRMTDEHCDDFLESLGQIDGRPLMEMEGEAKSYFEHALALREVIPALRHNPVVQESEQCSGKLDLVRCESLHGLTPETVVRFLRRNFYCVMCMAPLSPGALTLPESVPRFMGPAHPIISSAWFKLFLYDTTSSGPFSILYPRGERLFTLPREFRRCANLVVQGLRGEPAVVSSSSALHAINLSLQEQPTLVQAFDSPEEEESSSNHAPEEGDSQPFLLDIALPLTEDCDWTLQTVVHAPPRRESHIAEGEFHMAAGAATTSMDEFVGLEDCGGELTRGSSFTSSASEDPEMEEGKEATRGQHSSHQAEDEWSPSKVLSEKQRSAISAMVRLVATKVPCSTRSCGYMRLCRSGPPKTGTWLLLDMQLGVPLFSRRLAALALSKMSELRILSEASLDELTTEVETLVRDLSCQIDRWGTPVGLEQGGALTTAIDHVPPPFWKVCFDGTKAGNPQ